MHPIKRVAEFHTAFGHPISQTPTPGGAELREFRARILLEEVSELLQAMGVTATLTVGPAKVECEIIVQSCKEDHEIDLANMAKETQDVSYVLEGNNLVFGMASDALGQLVHDSNMSRVGSDGKPILREDGKILKGPNFWRAEPEIQKVLDICRKSKTNLLYANLEVIASAGRLLEESTNAEG